MSLTVEGALLDGARVGVRCEGATIVAIGPEVVAAPGDEVVDGASTAIVPGLVNGHGHAAMSLLRGHGDGLPLQRWLEEAIWPVEGRLDDDDVYWGTRLACLEMVRGGTVRFWDMYWHSDAVARAARDAGMRAAVGAPLVDSFGADMDRSLRDEAERMLDAGADELVTPCLAPHSVYLAGPPLLEWVAERSRATGAPVHIHLSETSTEVEECVEHHGMRPPALLDRLGALSPRAVLAHCVWFDDDELALVAERGATVVTNPVSNLKLASGGPFRFGAARAHGVSVGLGTDGAASNNSLDLLQDVKVMSLLEKHASGDASRLSAHEAWDVVTGRIAGALGQSGRVAVGQPADFCLVRLDRPELTPGDLVTNLVFAASGDVVDTTVIAGRVVMRHRVVEGADEVLAKARERAARLGIT